MLHGAHNLQNWQKVDELKQLWVHLTANDGGENVSKKIKKLKEPIVTRWWLVRACACSFVGSLSAWTLIFVAVRNYSPANSASSKIASCTLNLIRCAPIINNLHLLATFHKSWLFSHFKHLQLGDEKAGNTPSL